jgi:hypothetical protein
MSTPKYIQAKSNVIISTWTMINDLVLYPEDRLLLGECSDGDLLLVRRRNGLLQKFARFYDGTLISEPQQTVLSKHLWTIIGAIKAVERPLGKASLGAQKWYIRVLGREGDSELQWLDSVEKQAVDSTYLQELGRRLQMYNPNLCIIAGWKPSTLDEYPYFVAGKVLFYPKKNELASGFVSTWAKASRREMRRNWLKRREKPNIAVLFPIPPLTREKKEDRLASK